jgi:hypothetical protein
VSKQPLAIRWRLAIREDDDLSSSARLFGHVLSTYADNGSGEATASMRTIARGCGYSLRTAHYAKDELLAAKLIDLRPRIGRTSVLTLCLPMQSIAGVPMQSTTRTSATHCTQTHKNSDGGAASGSAPPISLDECAGCGEVLPLVIRDLYCCEECVQ